MRLIYFFSDVLHLMKAVRNCLFHSGSGRFGKLKLVNKITSDHINLTSYSVMRINLAAQVLSEKVGNVLNNFGPEETARTGKCCLMMDKFFDYLSVRNTKEHITKGRPFKTL